MKYSAKFLVAVLINLMMLPALFAQRSLYSDVKAHRVGDVITVILTENITGSSSTDSRTQSNTAGSASSSFSGNMLPMDAIFGADAQFDYNSDERALANQRQLLSGTLSVRISEIDESGNYLIEGSRSTEISGEIYSMNLSGIIRPTDINDANEVLSYRVADANIVYLNKGGISGLTRKKGIGRKVLWGVIGIVTGVSAIMAVN